MPKNYCLFLRDVSMCVLSYPMISSPKIKCGDWRNRSVNFYFEVKDRIGLDLAQTT